jgi:uncharacterized Tic20 family protein
MSLEWELKKSCQLSQRSRGRLQFQISYRFREIVVCSIIAFGAFYRLASTFFSVLAVTPYLIKISNLLSDLLIRFEKSREKVYSRL